MSCMSSLRLTAYSVAAMSRYTSGIGSGEASENEFREESEMIGSLRRSVYWRDKYINNDKNVGRLTSLLFDLRQTTSQRES